MFRDCTACESVQPTDNAVEKFALAERAVTAVMPNNEQRPEHGSLRQPVGGPYEGAFDGQRSSGNPNNGDAVSREIRERPECILLEAFLGDRGTNIRQRERRVGTVIERDVRCNLL